ncbi:hypothetical protein ACVQ8P_05470 [Dellaglioa sp. BT-FLS60]
MRQLFVNALFKSLFFCGGIYLVAAGVSSNEMGSILRHYGIVGNVFLVANILVLLFLAITKKTMIMKCWKSLMIVTLIVTIPVMFMLLGNSIYRIFFSAEMFLMIFYLALHERDAPSVHFKLWELCQIIGSYIYRLLLLGLSLWIIVNYLGSLNEFSNENLYNQLLITLMLVNGLVLLFLTVVPVRYVAKYWKSFSIGSILLIVISIGTSSDDSFMMEMYIGELVLVAIFLCSAYIEKNKNLR